jgi:hypothetical protein
VKKAQPVTPAPLSSSSYNTLTFSQDELETQVANAEHNSADPNAGIMAQMTRSIFLN